MDAWRPWALVAALATTVMFVNLGGAQLWDRDEPRNAGCGAEMLERGDWVTPVFNGDLRTHKPVLLYWLMMASYSVFGVDEFAARFWSAALAVGACLLTGLIGARLFSQRAGWLAAIVLATSLMFVVSGRAATPDSVLVFCTTAATAIYVVSAIPRDRQPDPQGEFPRLPRAIAMYGVLGLATLAKGPVGLVLPTAVIGMFLLLRRLPARTPADVAPGRRAAGLRLLRPFAPRHFLATCWRMRPLTALTVTLLVAAPWYIWVGVRTDGQWLRGFFWEHNLGRAMQTMEGHAGPPIYYLAALLVGLFPWSILIVPVLRDAGGRSSTEPTNDRRGVLFCLCWAGVYLGLFTLARTKLPSYILPCYPACALLVGRYLDGWLAGRVRPPERWFATSALVLLALGGVAIFGLPYAAERLSISGPNLAWLGLIPTAAGVAVWHWRRTEDHSQLVGALVVSAVLFVTGCFGFAAERVSKCRQYDRLWAAVGQESDTPLAAYHCLEPSWVFYAGRRIESVALAGDAVGERSPEAFFEESPQGFLLMTESRYRQDRGRLPELTVAAEANLFLQPDRLLLLRCGGTRELPADVLGSDSAVARRTAGSPR